SRLNQTQRFDDGLETLFTCQPWLRQLASVLPAPAPSEDSLRYSAEALAAWRQTLTRPHERPAKRLRLPSTPSAASSPLLPQHPLLLPPSPNQVSPLPAVATVATTSTALPLQEAALPLQEELISSAAQPLSHVHRSLVPELLELAPSQPLPDHLPVVPAPAGAPPVADLPVAAIPTIPTHAPTSDDPPCVPTMVQHSLGVEVEVQAPTSLTDD
ncbi:MAG: hypothetical protein Q8P67_05675, partial [archaeon]|nr:hypothetical protein [archaeon]